MLQAFLQKESKISNDVLSNQQSTIIYYECDKQVDDINDSKEQVDARNWLNNDSAEQVDHINDSEKLVVAKSNPSSDPKVATHTTNGYFTQKLFISRFAPKITPVVIGPINLLITVNVVGIQDILSLRQTVLPKASVTDAARSCARIFRGTPGKVRRTDRNGATTRDISSDENSRLSSPSPLSNPNSVYPASFRNQEVISPSHPSIAKRGRNA